MQVKAKELLYYGMKRRKAGEVFFLESEKDFSKKSMVKLAKDGSEIVPKEEIAEEAEVSEEKSEDKKAPVLRRK